MLTINSCTCSSLQGYDGEHSLIGTQMFYTVSLTPFLLGTEINVNLCSYCSYQSPDGQSMLRVTTVTRRWVDGADSSEVVSVVCF